MSESFTVEGRSAAYSCDVRQAPEGQTGFVAEFVDVPGCVAVGETRKEAMEAAERALSRWLERAANLGIKPPKPGSGHSIGGNLRVRTPKTVHRELALLANKFRMSLNEVVVQLCYRSVARDFEQTVVGSTEICSLIGPSRTVSRRPNGERFDPGAEFSGTWLQRIPGPLHLQLVAWAQNENVTINLMVNYILVQELEVRRHLSSVNHRNKAA